jgi:hypothetical protein
MQLISNFEFEIAKSKIRNPQSEIIWLYALCPVPNASLLAYFKN